jgi:putative DNA primase/helicase
VDQLKEGFGLAPVVSAQAVISDDAVDRKSSLDTKVFKKLITGESITANRKYKDHVSFRFHGPVCITANNAPQIDDETDAVLTRIVILSFDRKFTAADAKQHLKGKKDVVSFLTEIGEMPGVLNWALQGVLWQSQASLEDVSDRQPAS